MTNDLKDDPSTPRMESPVKGTALFTSSTRPRPISLDESNKTQRLSLRKARKLSRVFAEFSLLDSFAARKSDDDLRVTRRKPMSNSPRPATAHGHTYNTSLGEYSTHSLDGTTPPRSTSPTILLSPAITPITTLTMPISKSKSSLDNTPQSPIRINTPLTPQTKPSVPSSSENTSLPQSQTGSSSRSSVLVKKRRRSLDLKQSYDKLNSKASQSSRSQSLRITPISELPRPTTPQIPAVCADPLPDVRDPPASPEAARQHYVEVKRARKMTRLFGQELPQELIRVLDDRRKPEYARPRADSTGSSIHDSVPSTSMVEGYTNAPEGENMIPPSLQTKSHVEFQERRRRVAKLSQFFGVNHAEIASSLVFTKPDDHPSISLDEERGRPVSELCPEPIEVGVKVVSRRRWGLGEDMRDVELSDAINKLRCLKAN